MIVLTYMYVSTVSSDEFIALMCLFCNNKKDKALQYTLARK